MRREGGCWAVLTCHAFQKSHRHGCLIVGALGASKGRELNLAKCSTEYVQYAHAKPILHASEKVNYLVNTQLGLRTELDVVLLMFHSHRWTLSQLALDYFLHLLHRITRGTCTPNVPTT
ncbi:hypothetical protein MCOR02_006546 [Pyricularia oryzae]|nr:hypothetical protein MCOR02_006546 [Pyricularia oryzae]